MQCTIISNLQHLFPPNVSQDHAPGIPVACVQLIQLLKPGNPSAVQGIAVLKCVWFLCDNISNISSYVIFIHYHWHLYRQSHWYSTILHYIVRVIHASCYKLSTSTLSVASIRMLIIPVSHVLTYPKTPNAKTGTHELKAECSRIPTCSDMFLLSWKFGISTVHVWRVATAGT